jgi:hypothetical protein
MKAARLIALVLCFPALLSTQQITPMNIAVAPGHPGQKLLMLSHRDLLLVQARAWEEGIEMDRESECRKWPGMTEKSCEAIKVHVEPEAGSDSETILLHSYYRVDETPAGSTRYLQANNYADLIKTEIGSIGPKWLKWERRDNGAPAEMLR